MTTITMKEVAAFLLGEAPLDGFWFGERHPAGGFWWREHLRAALAAPATAQAAEIERLKTESEERLQNCAALVAENERLRAALALEPERKPKPFIGTLRAIYKCTDCGHEQSVTEVHTEHGVYVGSGANWCDKCELGKPERKETP